MHNRKSTFIVFVVSIDDRPLTSCPNFWMTGSGNYLMFLISIFLLKKFYICFYAFDKKKYNAGCISKFYYILQVDFLTVEFCSCILLYLSRKLLWNTEVCFFYNLV